MASRCAAEALSTRCRTKAFSTTCAVHVEDFESWWSSSGHGSVADILTAQVRCPGFHPWWPFLFL